MELTRVLRYLRDRKVKVAIVLILLVAAGLRLYGINWDQGYGFHPDERSIYMQSDCMYRILSNSQNYQDCNMGNSSQPPVTQKLCHFYEDQL